MDLLAFYENCERLNIQLKLEGEDTILATGPRKELTPSFLQELKYHKPDLLRVLLAVEAFQRRVVKGTYQEEGEEKRILCPYQDEERPINPEVCQWHREEEDPECKRLKCKGERIISKNKWSKQVSRVLRVSQNQARRGFPAERPKNKVSRVPHLEDVH
jgi:hypothetical protein